MMYRRRRRPLRTAGVASAASSSHVRKTTGWVFFVATFGLSVSRTRSTAAGGFGLGIEPPSSGGSTIASAGRSSIDWSGGGAISLTHTSPEMFLWPAALVIRSSSTCDSAQSPRRSAEARAGKLKDVLETVADSRRGAAGRSAGRISARAVATAAGVRTLEWVRGAGRLLGIGTPSICVTRDGVVTPARPRSVARCPTGGGEHTAERGGSQTDATSFRRFGPPGFRCFADGSRTVINAEGSQLLWVKAFASERFVRTERAGFEPAMGFKPHTAFPVLLLRPLGHLSGLLHTSRGHDFSGKTLFAPLSGSKL
jgi:hypothetical protein